MGTTPATPDGNEPSAGSLVHYPASAKGVLDRRFLIFAVRYGTRSLLRNRRRTILTLATVALSASVTILARQYASSAIKLWAESAHDRGLGHVQIHAEGFLENNEVLSADLMFSEDNEQLRRLADDPEVVAISRRLTFEGMVNFKDQNRYVMATAVEPESELAVSPLLFKPGHPGSRDVGAFLVKDGLPSDSEPVVIGRGLADALGVQINDEVTVMSATTSGGLNGVDGVVTGIMDIPVPELSRRAVYLPLERARTLLRSPGLLTEVALRLKGAREDPEVVDHWVSRNAGSFAGQELEMEAWWEIEPIVRNIETIWNTVVGLISFLLYLSATLSVLNIIFLLVAERTTEIGTMMAVGARGRDIRFLFCVEGGIIGVIGGFAGVAGANIVLAILASVGIPVESPFSSGVYMLYPSPSWPFSTVVLLGSVVVCVMAALPPAARAAGVEPVQAFRGQIN